MFVRGMWVKVLETVVFVTIWPPSIQILSEEKQCLAEQKCFVRLSLIWMNFWSSKTTNINQPSRRSCVDDRKSQIYARSLVWKGINNLRVNLAVYIILVGYPNMDTPNKLLTINCVNKSNIELCQCAFLESNVCMRRI